MDLETPQRFRSSAFRASVTTFTDRREISRQKCDPAELATFDRPSANLEFVSNLGRTDADLVCVRLVSRRGFYLRRWQRLIPTSLSRPSSTLPSTPNWSFAQCKALAHGRAEIVVRIARDDLGGLNKAVGTDMPGALPSARLSVYLQPCVQTALYK
ncbi:hypothetical protein NKH55_17110 [Mesorhizobium opportunistum]|uniref:hypothetical protein n=1 Tax=Mesorhizobium opportunistum TaxID=593909 RepID=UPI003338998A